MNSKPPEHVDTKRAATFDKWQIPTSGDLSNEALDRPFIDHVALSPDLEVTSMQFIHRFDDDGCELSDHNGVCIEVRVPHVLQHPSRRR